MKTKISPYKPKIKLGGNQSFHFVSKTVSSHNLHTICESGLCPNKSECWGRGTATFMILGNTCTRSCKFCGVATGKPAPIDFMEPENIANSIKLMKLKHVVITSVTRDDLSDGGAQFWHETIKKIKEINKNVTIETLIPDMKGDTNALDLLLEAKPDVISHNLETVKSLTKQIRIQAKYERSLDVLKYLSKNGARTKSGIMLGLGEKKHEVLELLDDLLATNCKIITIGQYLPPSKKHAELHEYIPMELFNEYKTIALNKGFEHAESSPFVRSSYMAEKHINSKN